MAWQAPKTDWTSADGVRDTDLNRIEENTRVLYLEKLRGRPTITVSLSGNDTTGTGSTAAPYRTVAKALSALPRNLNGWGAVIYFASAGTYAETVEINNFTNGTIVLSGPANAAVSIMGLRAENASVQVSNIALTCYDTGVYGTGVFAGVNGSIICASGSMIVTAGGVTARYGGLIEVTTTLTVNNADRALQAQYGATISVATLNGTNNSIGIYAYNSAVYVSTFNLTAAARIINENSIVNTRGVV